MHTIRCLVVVATVVASVLPADGSVTRKGDTFSVIAATSRGSAVAYDSTNHVYLMVSASGTVWGRLVAENGTFLSSQIKIQASTNYTHFPRVAFSADANGGNGGFLVTWHESDLAGGATSIHARIVSAAGALVSPDTQIAADRSWWEAGAAVAYATGTKEFLVAWRCLTNNDIHARRVSNTGAALGTIISVTATTIYEDNPSIGYNPTTDEFLVGYAGYNDPALYAFVSAQRVKPGTGALLGGPTLLTTATGTYITDTVYSAASGRFLVSWYQLVGTYGRQVDASGNTVGGVFLISTRVAAYDALSVAFNPFSNTMLLVSHDSWGSVEDTAVELNGTGTPLDGGQQITAAAGTGNFYPRVAANARSKEWLVSSAHSFTSTIGQFAQTDSAGGSSGPAPLQVTLSSTSGDSFPAGTSATFTANATGGVAPITYQFWLDRGSGWSIVKPYGTSNSYTFTPAAGTYSIQVWARNAGSSDNYDAWTAKTFTVTSAQATITTFAANQTFPLAFNIPITWTATASAGGANVEYKFWRYSTDTGWQVAQNYSATNSYTWFPSVGVHAVQVWVRRVGSSAAYEDWRTSGFFTIGNNPATISSLTANVSFPSSPNTTITWTATASGGSGALEYKFWLFRSSSGSWTVLRDWGSSNQASWTPGVGSTGQNVVQAWVRTVGNSAAYEDWASTGFFSITDSTGLSLTSNRALSGLHAGDLVTFTGQMMGPGGPYEYAFWIYNGTGWTLARGYSATNSYTWAVPAGTLAVQVWSRAIESNTPWERWQTSGLFVVSP